MITPNEAKKITDEETSMLAKIEETIDEKLKAAARTGTSAEISATMFGDNKVIAQELRDRYTAAGWYLEYSYAQNGGSYRFLTYKPVSGGSPFD